MLFFLLFFLTYVTLRSQISFKVRLLYSYDLQVKTMSKKNNLVEVIMKNSVFWIWIQLFKKKKKGLIKISIDFIWRKIQYIQLALKALMSYENWI